MTMSDRANLDRRAFFRLSLTAAAAAPVAIAHAAAPSAQVEADLFLSEYAKGWLPLDTAASEAAWAASTDVSEEHTGAQVARMLEVNRFVGSPEVIAKIKSLLDRKNELNDLTARQLEKARLRAAESPGTIPEVVKARAEAEAKQ